MQQSNVSLWKYLTYATTKPAHPLSDAAVRSHHALILNAMPKRRMHMHKLTSEVYLRVEMKYEPPAFVQLTYPSGYVNSSTLRMVLPTSLIL